MKKAKPTPVCSFKNCKKPLYKKGVSWSRFCYSHRYKVSTTGFLGNLYRSMRRRVEGRTAHNRGNWAGKPILPKDVFVQWAKNHPDFLASYKRWFSNGFDRKLTPSVNRMNSNKGYVLGNMEWMTNSQNSGLSGEVRKMKNKKAIYDLLGVTNG